MVRAPVVGVLLGSVFVVLSHSVAMPGTAGQTPVASCVDATFRTVEARIDHLVDVLASVERGADLSALPPAPSDARLAACGVR